MAARRLLQVVLLLVVLAFAVVATAEPWSFGVIADTQWLPATPENQSVAVHVIDAVNRRFIDAKVDLVLQVGDLTNNGSDAALDMRAKHNQALAEAGIPFYPLRGNHERWLHSARHFGRAFPGLPGTPGAGGSSPKLPGAAGLAYAFVHQDVKFILLDQFTLPDGSARGRACTMADYQPWIDRELKAKDHRHAFVLAHKPLVGANCSDRTVGWNFDHPEMQNAFIGCLQKGGVRYFLCGHNHLHQRSRVASPDGRSSVEQIIGAPASHKLYPVTHQSPRVKVLKQETNRIGYYIFTVDGPRVVGRYWSTAPFGAAPADPAWELRDTFGYSLPAPRPSSTPAHAR